MKQNLEYVVPIKLYTEPQKDCLNISFDKNKLVIILERMHEQTKSFACSYYKYAVIFVIYVCLLYNIIKNVGVAIYASKEKTTLCAQDIIKKVFY